MSLMAMPMTVMAMLLPLTVMASPIMATTLMLMASNTSMQRLHTLCCVRKRIVPMDPMVILKTMMLMMQAVMAMTMMDTNNDGWLCGYTQAVLTDRPRLESLQQSQEEMHAYVSIILDDAEKMPVLMVMQKCISLWACCWWCWWCGISDTNWCTHTWM